jgi:hypothetical protein
MFEFNYIIVNPTSEFACIEDLAFALRAEVISSNTLKVESKLVDRSQFAFLLPIYNYELVDLSAFSFSPSPVFTDILIQSDEELYALAGENLWGEPRVIEHIPAMTDEEFSSILPTIWD